MKLLSLSIQYLRIVREAAFSLAPGFNHFSGLNGSGKTTLFEAISLLGLGRSFRTRQNASLIQKNEKNLIVRGELGNGTVLAVSKSLNAKDEHKINQNTCRTVSELARLLPFLLVNHESLDLVSGNAALRRQFLDWSVFHVEQFDSQIWKRYQEALKNRNAVLRLKRYNELVYWNEVLFPLAEQIDFYRQKTFLLVSEYFKSIFATLNSLPLDIHYNRGWDPKLSLREAFHIHLAQDKHLHYTTQGPHRADLIFSLYNKHAKTYVSRGQEKTIALALILAQAQYLEEKQGKTALILLDDLGAELDERHQNKMIALLAQKQHQVLIASPFSVDSSSYAPFIEKRFHVEHGVVSLI